MCLGFEVKEELDDACDFGIVKPIECYCCKGVDTLNIQKNDDFLAFRHFQFECGCRSWERSLLL